MLERSKVEDFGQHEPIFHAKLEENHAISASYVTIKDPRRHITKVEIYTREARIGNYRRCYPKLREAEFF